MIRASRAAGNFLCKHQCAAVQIAQSYKDFVTDADLKSEKIILQVMDGLVPVYSEEAGGKLTPHGVYLVVDPLDGSINYFSQDARFWGVSLALVNSGKSQIGLLNFPANDYMIGATSGGLFTVDSSDVLCGSDLKVSKNKSLKSARVWTDWSKDNMLTLVVAAKLRQLGLYPQIRLCATASLLEVASGRIDGYIHPGPQPEDIAAAGMIVEQAGGVVTDMDGKPWSVFSKSIVATNGLIHNELVETLQS